MAPMAQAKHESQGIESGVLVHSIDERDNGVVWVGRVSRNHAMGAEEGLDEAVGAVEQRGRLVACLTFIGGGRCMHLEHRVEEFGDTGHEILQEFGLSL